MNKYTNALANSMIISANEENNRKPHIELTMGRIVGTSGDKYIVEMLERTYTIPSVNGAKHNLNESVWICQPYGNTNQQFILGGEIKSETIIGTVTSVSGKTGDVILNKSDIGLNNVDNTSDLNKPISTETQTALNNKADKTSVLTPVPENAKFTDTVTTVNGKTGEITKDDIVALGIPAQDTVYSHPSTHPASMITGLSTVATSGNYSDLINKPAIPTKTSQLTNDSGYINASSSISGNSATSTKLQTPRTINGVSFDGTRNITISATPISHTHPKSQISDMPTKLSQFIDDIGASGGEQGALIFDTLAAQQGAKLKEYKVGENYVSEIRLSSNNLLLASKTESRSGENYITTIKVYNDDGVTIKQTITITESKDSSGNYITTIS